MAVRASNAKIHAERRSRSALPASRPARPAPAVPLAELIALPASRPSQCGWLLDVRAADEGGAVSLVDAQATWGWGPGTRLGVRVTDTAVVLTPGGGTTGAVRVDRRGRVCLPLAWRRIHRIDSAGRVAILTAPADHDQLVQIQPAGLAARRIRTADTAPAAAADTPD